MIKKIIAAVLAATLFIPVLADREPDEVRLPVVMYHHISPLEKAWNDYVISIDEFRSDMEYLKAHGWTPISVAQLLAWREGEFTMPEKPMMITFDDGFASTKEYAEPILAEMGFRAVAAVIGTVSEHYTETGEYNPLWSHLSWQEAEAMADRGVIDIQCHTWDLHSMDGSLGCSKRPGEDAWAYRNRLGRDLAKFLSESGRQSMDLTMALAYPYGAYNKDSTEVLKEMGFEAAFTCEEKINLLTGEGDELYYIGRYNRPHGISSKDFFEKWEKELDMG